MAHKYEIRKASIGYAKYIVFRDDKRFTSFENCGEAEAYICGMQKAEALALQEPEHNCSKLLAHFKRMQEMACNFLVPETYTDLDGRKAADNHWTKRNAYFTNDMLYMLDGPEQREAQAEAEQAAKVIDEHAIINWLTKYYLEGRKMANYATNTLFNYPILSGPDPRTLRGFMFDLGAREEFAKKKQ